MAPPSPDEVRAQLERVLSAPSFASGRHPRFLRYVVERALAGDADQLKEYVLGLEVFDRTDEYDPRLDSIVRVEARRLRARLEEYYAGRGAEDPVVIEIPRGTYAPVFTTRALPVPEPEPESATEALPPLSLKRWVALAGLSGALAVVGLSGWRTLPPATGSSAAVMPHKAEVRIAVLPFQFFSTDPAIAMLAARLTDGVTTELARLGTLSVVSRTSAAQFMSDQRPVSEVASILGADVVMEGSAVVEDGRLKVVARLVDGLRDRKVWVGEYLGNPTEVDTLQARIASEAGPAAIKVTSATR